MYVVKYETPNGENQKEFETKRQAESFCYYLDVRGKCWTIEEKEEGE